MRTLQEILDATGRKVHTYSGRGMFGRECVAVDCDNVLRLMADIISDLDDEDERGMVAVALRTARQDSMGTGDVVYFPAYPYAQGPETGDV